MNANGFTKHSSGRPSFGLAALVAAAALATAGGASASDSDPTGVWLDSAGRGAVEITSCSPGSPGGSGGTLCGRVVWVKSASHQKRCGEQILGNLEAGGDGTWGSGWIYSPDRGRKFDVEIKRIGPDKLRVMGYAGVRMFSETHVWKRAAPDLTRCGSEQTAQATSKDVATQRDATAKTAAKADVVAAAPAVPPIASAEVAAASASPSSSAEASAGPAPVSPPASVAGRSTDSPAAAKSRAEPKAAKTAEKRAPRDDGAGEKSPAGKYFKRYADGTCKVDTPWIQMRFDCRRP